ncbi:hypothetical protein [Pontibacter akesuensis]|uniref:hypothetical protein n=1 Tax=Pontibacter akesuensis TaxID=388950 RepID=UPI001113EB60|nr:hypothetical protein [Pontibacter akesuensis]
MKSACKALWGITLLLYVIAAGSAFAQGAAADTAFLQSSKAQAVAAYKKALGAQTQLYNGTEYVDYKLPYFEGHQFFASNAAENGHVFYDGTWYTDVPILYDLVRDEVIIPYSTTGLKMKLIGSKIDTFQVHDHLYVRLQPDSAGATALQPGFYDLLYSGDTQFLMKRIKQMEDRATQDGMEGEFRNVDKYFIKKDGVYHQVGSKRAVYRVLEDRKKELKKFASSQQLKFRKEKEAAILAIVTYYDSLAAAQPQDK